MKTIEIESYTIGRDSSVFIIAELSANHNQDFDLAVKTLEAARSAGADAIKLQTYRPDTITLDSDLPHFRTREDSPWAGQKLYDLYAKAYTPWEWHVDLQKVAHDLGLVFFSSPFDFTSVDLLEKLDVPAYKVASPEITDIPLIERIARIGKPVIISTGIAEEADIRLAVETCRKAGNDQLALLKCTTAYPTPLEEVNLLAIPTLARTFNTVVGLSDHTMETVVPVGSVALGGRIIEKHLILDRSLGGVDSSFSLNPAEFKTMVEEVRKVEKALGDGSLKLTDKQRRGRKMARSLFVVKDIAKGEKLTSDNIRSIRPGIGLHPNYFREVIGKVASRNMKKGEPLDSTSFS